mmetsp:Transcript_17423/g.48896  ORF Transcript_17423/g.48896 Transcript_17423/m.48896 type:complete len:246 (-) Transcript_17423:523-1260(-)
MRALLEMSYLPPTAALCSPDEPRGCRPSAAHTASKRSMSSASLGTLIITLARSPVPRFDGHVPMKPRWSLYMNSRPSALIESSTAFTPRVQRANTSFTLPPFCMLITRMWSSSFTHTRNVFSSLWKMPRASGQSRAAPAFVSSVPPPGFWNRKWSSCSFCSSSAVMPPSGKYLPFRSPSRRVRPALSRRSTSRRSARVVPGGSARPRTLRPLRMRVDTTYLSNLAQSPSLRCAGSRSDVCLSVGL